eukprot:613445-Alexandrium_andersonii.AAC.1
MKLLLAAWSCLRLLDAAVGGCCSVVLDRFRRLWAVPDAFSQCLKASEHRPPVSRKHLQE